MSSSRRRRRKKRPHKTARERITMQRHLITPCLALLFLAACHKSQGADAAAKIPQYDLTPASNTRYLADFAAKPGVIKTQDGLEYRIIKSGTGKAPQSGADMVTVK